MDRKAYKSLLKWKHSESRKPLLILGARQTGKTWLMREFGRKEYANTVYINCDSEPLMQTLFTTDYDIGRLILAFQAISGQTISDDGSTLIILDEIQEAPRAIHSLKYFCENAPQYHIMAAGSLLGVALSRQESFPVGKVDILHIYPMDFEEFMRACGKEMYCEILAKADYAMAASFAEKYIELLRQYYYVGGMPEAVEVFVTRHDLNEVRTIQQNIITAYGADMSKHTSKTETVRISQVFQSLPSQLAKENRKFIYGVAKPGARAADFEMAIQWLIDAGIVYRISRVNKVSSPLKYYEDISAFKLFLLDVGLLGCMALLPPTIILDNPLPLSEYRGMMAEQYVAQQLSSADIPLFYWSNTTSPAEIDFLHQGERHVCAIEVKASTNVRGKSISMLVKENAGTVAGIRFSLLPFCRQETLTNYPLYAVPFVAPSLSNL